MKGAQKRFLEELFGVCGVSGEPEKRSIEWAVESFEELPGCLLVAGKHPFRKLLICQLASSVGSSSPFCLLARLELSGGVSPRNHVATLSKTPSVA